MKKFSIRDLFWLLLVAAILCGWWLEHRDKVRQREEFRMHQQQLHNEMVRSTSEVLKNLRGARPSDKSSRREKPSLMDAE